jgi:hypothetical protein
MCWDNGSHIALRQLIQFTRQRVLSIPHNIDDDHISVLHCRQNIALSHSPGRSEMNDFHSIYFKENTPAD